MAVIEGIEMAYAMRGKYFSHVREESAEAIVDMLKQKLAPEIATLSA